MCYVLSFVKTFRVKYEIGLAGGLSLKLEVMRKGKTTVSAKRQGKFWRKSG